MDRMEHRMDDKQYVEALEPAVVILGLALAFCLVAGIVALW